MWCAQCNALQNLRTNLYKSKNLRINLHQKLGIKTRNKFVQNSYPIASLLWLMKQAAPNNITERSRMIKTRADHSEPRPTCVPSRSSETGVLSIGNIN